MDTRRRHLEEQMRWRETENSKLRGDLHQLKTKFVQLERAFGINLECQRRRENEINRIKHESQELRSLTEETLGARAEISSRLMNAINEKDHWKNAFLRQRELTKRYKTDHEDAVDSVKRECEGILRMTRETTEKHFRELIELYNRAREKAHRFEEEEEMSRVSQRRYEDRSFELANLLETLKSFDVNVKSVCQLVAEALKNLCSQEGSFEKNLKDLRHLAWTVQETKDNTEMDVLKEQNLVLREVVKSLKRKIQELETQKETSAGRSQEGTDSSRCRTEIKPQNFNNNPTNKLTSSSMDRAIVDISSTRENYANCDANERSENKGSMTSDNANQIRNLRNENTIRDFDKDSKVFCIESHSNGVFYEEYVFRFSTDREIKIKYPTAIKADGSMIKMEFVDDESEYEKVPLDGMAIFLKNIYASVKIKQTGVPCGTQTKKSKTSSSFSQTLLTGVNMFSRLNVGVTVLNSEKRAIERSLYNLERTVATLKFNTLDQARNMIGKGSRFVGNDEFFECVRGLTQ